MSSNIRLKRICQNCSQPFIAKTTVTKFCSDDCAKRNYKKRLKEQKVTESILETNSQVIKKYTNAEISTPGGPGSDGLNREWINIEDLAELLGIAERTIFRRIKDKEFPKLKIGRRLVFNKQQVIDYLISKSERI